MKKLLLLPAVALMMASCGGEDVCSCVKLQKDMAEKSKDIDYSDEEGSKKAIAAIEDEYKDQIEACDKLKEANEKEYEALSSDKEKKAFQEKIMNEIKECGEE